jgi:hypothetical protein
MLMQHQSSRVRVPDWLDPEQIPHLALEATGGKRQVGQRRDLRMFSSYLYVQLHPAIRRSARKEIDDPQRHSIVGVMCSHEGETEAARQQRAGHSNEFIGRQFDNRSRRPVVRAGDVTLVSIHMATT